MIMRFVALSISNQALSTLDIGVRVALSTMSLLSLLAFALEQRQGALPPLHLLEAPL